MDYLDRVPDFKDEELFSPSNQSGEHLLVMRLHESSYFNHYRLIIQTNRNAYSVDFDRRSTTEKLVEYLRQLADDIELG